MEEENKIETIEKNKKLIEKYPFLLPRSPWTGKVPDDYDYSWTERYGIPDGWINLFDEFCEVFNVLFKQLPKETQDHFYFTQIKEKYGTLRLYNSGCTDEMWAVIHYYENLSGFTCWDCGKQPKNSKGKHIIWNSHGYILPYCKQCVKIKEYNFEKKYFDEPISRKKYLNEHYTKYTQKGPMCMIKHNGKTITGEEVVLRIKKQLGEKAAIDLLLSGAF